MSALLFGRFASLGGSGWKRLTSGKFLTIRKDNFFQQHHGLAVFRGLAD
jgi:hypothetical protein